MEQVIDNGFECTMRGEGISLLFFLALRGARCGSVRVRGVLQGRIRVVHSGETRP